MNDVKLAALLILSWLAGVTMGILLSTSVIRVVLGE